MTSRSTRNRIRLQLERAANNLDRAMEHIAKADAFQGAQSNFLEKTIPNLVVILEGAKNMLLEVRERC